MGKKKNKNKNRGMVDVYDINPEQIANIARHSDLNVESDEDEYWEDPNHPMYRNINDSSPATRENLSLAASYEDFLNPPKKKKKNKKIEDQKDLQNFLKGVVEDGRDDDEFRNQFLDDEEELAEDDGEEENYEDGYDADDPYNIQMTVKPGLTNSNVVFNNKEEVKDKISYEKPRIIPAPPAYEGEIPNNESRVEEVKVEQPKKELERASDYMLLSEICKLTFKHHKELGRLYINDNIAPVSFIDLSIVNRQYFDYEEENVIGLISEGGSNEVIYDRYVDMVNALKKFIICQLHPAAIFEEEEFFVKFKNVEKLDVNSFRFFYEVPMGKRGAMIYGYHIPKSEEDQLRSFVKATAESLMKDPFFMEEYNPYYVKNGENCSAVNLCAELLVYLYLAKSIRDNHVGFLFGNEAYMDELTSKYNMKDEFIQLIIQNRRTKLTQDTSAEESIEDIILERLDVYSCGNVHDMGNAILDFFEGLDIQDEDKNPELVRSEDANPTPNPNNALKVSYDMYVNECKEDGENPVEFDEFVRCMTVTSIKNPEIEGNWEKLYLGNDEEEDESSEDESEEIVVPLPEGHEVVDLSVTPETENRQQPIGNNVMAEALEKAIQGDTGSNDGKMVVPVRRKN